MNRPDSQAAADRQSFAGAFDPRKNAFGFLRLLLAVLVIFSHCYPLGGFGIDPLERATEGQHTIGLAAVAMFFVLSGFLICRSACRTTSVARFLWHRFLRIFPGYWLSLVLSGCVFAPLVALYEHGVFFRVFAAPGNSPQAYILGNATLFHVKAFSIEAIVNMSPQSIAGLLSHNPFPYTVNGSLWTLPFEVGCYLGVAGLAFLGMMRKRAVTFGLFATLFALNAVLSLSPETFYQWLPFRALGVVVMLSLFFTAGCVAFLYRAEIRCSAILFTASVIALPLSLMIGAFGVVAPIALSYAILWLAFRLPLAQFEARGDFSYGTYIYAFPVQQGMALLGLHHGGFAVYFISSSLLTALLAVASYRLVEAPCLRLKHLKMPTWRLPSSAQDLVIAAEAVPFGNRTPQ